MTAILVQSRSILVACPTRHLRRAGSVHRAVPILQPLAPAPHTRASVHGPSLYRLRSRCCSGLDSRRRDTGAVGVGDGRHHTSRRLDSDHCYGLLLCSHGQDPATSRMDDAQLSLRRRVHSRPRDSRHPRDRANGRGWLRFRRVECHRRCVFPSVVSYRMERCARGQAELPEDLLISLSLTLAL